MSSWTILGTWEFGDLGVLNFGPGAHVEDVDTILVVRTTPNFCWVNADIMGLNQHFSVARIG